MSDVISIEQLRANFTDKMKSKELKEYALAQHKTLELLTNENNILKTKLEHLQKLLMSLEKNNIVSQVSPEEMICVEQIELLKHKSNDRELSLDEIKRLDILVKNLRLIRGESTEVINTRDFKSISEEDLVRIAVSAPENK